jgi:hypothetical protein
MRVIRRRSGAGEPRTSRLGAVFLGALAGMAVGILLADRGVLSQLQSRFGHAAGDDGDSADDDGDEHEDDLAPVPPRRGRTGSRGTAARPVSAAPSASAARRTRVDPEAELEARVLETFKNDPVLMDRPIDIGAIGTGIIELTGWVDAAPEVRHATTLTRGTIGVHTVVNRLLVRGEAAG